MTGATPTPPTSPTKPTSPTPLHPAITVTNIKNFVLVTLEMDSGQYTSWAELFKIHCRAFQVLDHIILRKTSSSITRTTDEQVLWDCLDAIVLQWIYSIISNDLLNTILRANATATQAWSSLARDPKTKINHPLSPRLPERLSMCNNPVVQTSFATTQPRRMITAHIADKTEAAAVAIEVVAGAAASQKGVEIPTTSLPPALAWNQQQPIPSTSVLNHHVPTLQWPSSLQPDPLPLLLGPRPTAQPHQAYTASETQYTPTEIDQAFATMSLNQQDPNWYVDSGTTSHMTNNPGNYSSYVNNGNIRNIIVGDGAKIPIQGTSNQTLSHPFPPFSLNNVLYIPTIVKNLLSVRKLTTDNNLSIEFDPYGFTLKDFQTRTPLLRCNSVGDLYPSQSTPLVKSQLLLPLLLSLKIYGTHV
ncbi:hypothetical protein OSB04_023796 [Centaurea solstitialis]|uniref:Retrovirus-related Pol polyprotein from transposon TNT 1-94-like beta-barrel domain-containing protein n=1 Tax=Centaurea solstitialis TaxID=347529 RepID=A0AA38SLL0_9ASTR|nr:hypothetical protein OSB04_023796 [Centaurea solstitialis]